jgi:PEGA domain
MPTLTLVVAGLLAVALAPALAEAQSRVTRGQAVPRTVYRPVHRPIVHHYSYPYYRPATWWTGYGYPWGFHFAFGYPFYGYPSPYLGLPYYGYPSAYGYYPADITTSVRLRVSPREAEVFVDGYTAGVVDDFDGTFQRLRLQPGGHEIAVYLDGYRTFRQNLYLNPGATQTIRHELQPLGQGENMEPPPSPSSTRPDVSRPSTPNGRYGQPSPTELPAEGARSVDVEPRVRFGTLAIRLQPTDAELLVDGERWTSPADSSRLAIELVPGRHTVEVRKAGFANYREDVLIRPGATTNLNVSLGER